LKKLLLFIVLIPYFSIAEECIYDASAYTNFATKYASENLDATIDREFVIEVLRDRELIKVSGGGCYHIGYSITLSSDSILSEQKFLDTVIELVAEFGSWVGYLNYVTEVISQKKWNIHNGNYFFNMDGMAVFIANYDAEGIYIEFYLN